LKRLVRFIWCRVMAADVPALISPCDIGVQLIEQPGVFRGTFWKPIKIQYLDPFFAIYHGHRRDHEFLTP